VLIAYQALESIQLNCGAWRSRWVQQSFSCSVLSVGGRGISVSQLLHAPVQDDVICNAEAGQLSGLINQNGRLHDKRFVTQFHRDIDCCLFTGLARLRDLGKRNRLSFGPSPVAGCRRSPALYPLYMLGPLK